MAKWENEDWVTEKPDPEKIVCNKCFLRAEDRKVGESVIKGCTLGICKAFPVTKPSEVLWKGAECPYFIDENEE